MKKIKIFRILAGVLIFPLLILSGCGSGEGPDTFVDSDSGTGGVGFSLKWQTPETLLNKPLNLAAPKIDCVGLGIITVTVSVYASNNDHLNGKDFPCSAGKGSVGGISAQTGVKVTVEGKNYQGEPLYRGEKVGIDIVSGVVTNVGEVTMLLIPSSASSITAFSIDGAEGTIDEEAKSISVQMPYGTVTGSLIAAFTTTGTGVQVAGVEQTSGVTVNDFNAPVVYTVTAADGTSSEYSVTVTVALSSSKEIAAYTLSGVSGTINEEAKSISVQMPYGTETGSLIATFTTTGTGVQVAGVDQASGVTVNDFNAPVVYTVTAADGTSSEYSVTVTVPLLSPEKKLTAFLINGVAGVIDEAKKTVSLNLPYGTDLSALIATFTVTGESVQVASAGQISGAAANDFTDPVIYTVTAADGTSSDYTVTVSVPLLNPAKSLTAFSINGVAGIINEAEKSVAITVVPSTSLSSLIATFTTTGESVKVGDVVQSSGITANDFTNPVTYTVTAADTTTADYTVTVATGTSYTNNGNGTVTDNITSLMWQREDNNSLYNWTSALSLCNGLSLGGQSDWRLPTIDELKSIIDKNAGGPAIDTVNFPGTNARYYWSATAWGTAAARVGYFGGSGGTAITPKSSVSNYVRCVRGGQ